MAARLRGGDTLESGEKIIQALNQRKAAINADYAQAKATNEATGEVVLSDVSRELARSASPDIAEAVFRSQTPRGAGAGFEVVEEITALPTAEARDLYRALNEEYRSNTALYARTGNPEVKRAKDLAARLRASLDSDLAASLPKEQYDALKAADKAYGSALGSFGVRGSAARKLTAEGVTPSKVEALVSAGKGGEIADLLKQGANKADFRAILSNKLSGSPTAPKLGSTEEVLLSPKERDLYRKLLASSGERTDGLRAGLGIPHMWVGSSGGRRIITSPYAQALDDLFRSAGTGAGIYAGD